MREFVIGAALMTLTACNGTSMENKGQELGAKADDAVADVNNATDELGSRIENVADRADESVEHAANSVDRQIDKVENAADAASDELKK